jgi:hypothetical protein
MADPPEQDTLLKQENPNMTSPPTTTASDKRIRTKVVTRTRTPLVKARGGQKSLRVRMSTSPYYLCEFHFNFFIADTLP